MDAELLKIIFESASGTTILALGFWYVISRMRRNGKTDPAYVSKSEFHTAVTEGRDLADTRHTDTLSAIDTWGTKIETAANTDRQNLFDHVSNHD